MTLVEALRGAGLLTPRYLERLDEEAEARRQSVAQLKATGELDEAPVDPAPEDESPPHLLLLTLCDVGALVGGLTVDLDVRPDELVGPLTALIGASAVKLRVTDVHDGPPLKLTVFFQDHEESWDLEDLYPFVHNINDLLKEDPRARIVAVLGEWEDALQLWAVEKSKLPWLFKQKWFHPRNRHQLEAMKAKS